MWEFPSSGAFISNNGFFIVWCLGALIASMLAWAYVYSSIKNNTKESLGEFLKNIAIGAVSLLAVVFVSIGIFSKYREVRKCQSLDLSRIKSIRVRKMSNEHNFAGSTVLFNDSNKIQEGLRTLKSAYSRERRKVNGSREKFVYGYQIKLILDDDSPAPVLYYFSETDNSQKDDIVIPHCDASSDAVESTDDVYSSSNFGEWLRANVEPLFKQVR